MQQITSSPRVKPLYRGTQVIWYVLSALEILLALRFLLRLFAANPAAGFTTFIYSLSRPFVQPFLNVFSPSRVEGSVFEWGTLLAMIVYWIIAWGIVKLLIMSKPVSSSEAAVKLEDQNNL